MVCTKSPCLVILRSTNCPSAHQIICQIMYILGPDNFSSAVKIASLWMHLFGKKRFRSTSGDSELSSSVPGDFRVMGPVRLYSIEHRASPQSKRRHGCPLSAFCCAAFAYFVTMSSHVAVRSLWSTRAVWRVTKILSGFCLLISPLNL